MSRFILQSKRYIIAYGDDSRTPGMGYFFQVYDKLAITDYDEGLIVNEGYTQGLHWIDMVACMSNIRAYDIKPTPEFTQHLLLISANKPI